MLLFHLIMANIGIVLANSESSSGDIIYRHKRFQRLLHFLQSAKSKLTKSSGKIWKDGAQGRVLSYHAIKLSFVWAHYLLSNGWRTFTINILQWRLERSFFFRATISTFNKCLRSVDHDLYEIATLIHFTVNNRICYFTLGTLKHSSFLEKMVTKYPFQLTVGSKLKNSRSP